MDDIDFPLEYVVSPEPGQKLADSIGFCQADYRAMLFIVVPSTPEAIAEAEEDIKLHFKHAPLTHNIFLIAEESQSLDSTDETLVRLQKQQHFVYILEKASRNNIQIILSEIQKEKQRNGGFINPLVRDRVVKKFANMPT